MEMEEIQAQGCKFPRIGNGRIVSNKIGRKENGQYLDKDDGEVRKGGGGGSGNDVSGGGGAGRVFEWPSSRIVRVSRGSSGKDRHSKVWTSKGLRDRRVRLAVNTAIQFYDLQDRLGYDQPSKAVEWLLKAAASSITELPSINTSFPDTPNQLNNEKRSGTEYGFDSAKVKLDGDLSQQQHHVSLSKSACSSTSETSKGSGLSLSRSENRIKARERARERAAEKEKEDESRVTHHQNVNPNSQNSSFTELLTCGISSKVSNNTTSPNGSAHQNHGCGESNLFHRSPRHWSSTPMNYFATGLAGPSSSQTSGFSGQINLGNSLPQSMTVSPFNITGDHHPELQHFSFVPDHLVPASTTASGSSSDYSLNFTISSGLAAFNRGTLQSNSQSLLPHLQRFSPIDGSNIPFFIGNTALNAAPVENHHQFPRGFELCYGDGSRHSDQKGKGKN